MYQTEFDGLVTADPSIVASIAALRTLDPQELLTAGPAVYSAIPSPWNALYSSMYSVQMSLASKYGLISGGAIPTAAASTLAQQQSSLVSATSSANGSGSASAAQSASTASGATGASAGLASTTHSPTASTTTTTTTTTSSSSSSSSSSKSGAGPTSVALMVGIAGAIGGLVVLL